MTKKALITGITDGSYLAEHLLSLDYEVHGLVRRVGMEDPERRFGRITHLLDRLHLQASLESYPSIFHILSRHEFDEAAESDKFGGPWRRRTGELCWVE